ncbi:S8 family serine peptidase [Candidatus Poseidoniales archaeon]|nr:S8 family serine peptidase [Candidatus Poseidoniales archaeon]MDA8557297.1 S8 family serine peptidase [Candidatus Poseidoniales archaeon]MDA8724467.1 S8 family serine peptidase [Candidatus Poseidoniales archaeon]
MRRAIVMVLLLFLPAANAYVAPEVLPDEPPMEFAGEVLLTLHEGVWTHEAWSSLHENGVHPLRVVSPTELVGWHDGWIKSPSYTVSPSPEAVWKTGLDGRSPVVGDFVRLLLEPRLPDSAYDGLRGQLSAVGISLPNQYTPSPLAPSYLVEWPGELSLSDTLGFEGILWIEPVLETQARNAQSSSLMQSGIISGHAAWSLGLNGAGVVVGAADSGLDADHACFRNASVAGAVGSSGENGSELVGEGGPDHRKMVFLNTTIDGGDTQGHSDYRHGTHVAGTLSCYNVDSERQGTFPDNGSALAHGTRLVMQDIVSSDGWVPPDVDALLVEAGLHGAVIHSNSWGDDTTAYTARTSDFDAWALAMPWSLSFIAPGNTGSDLLEPANGRNIAAIGASVKSAEMERWSASSTGPTEAGTNGIFALAVGTSIQSARADGITDSYNSGLRTSSGTSMATPGAAGVAAIIQQMVEQGWISGNEVRTNSSMSAIAPNWSVEDYGNASLLLAEGFTPSGPMLRALLALSTTQLPEEERNGGQGSQDLQNVHDGWGQLNLSALIDFDAVATELTEGSASPANDVWIHDAYRLTNDAPAHWLEQRQAGLEPLENLIENPWNGSGAAGPFMQTGDVWVQKFTLRGGEGFDARMAHLAAPEPTAVNDLQLVARLSDGRVAVDGVFDSSGNSVLYSSSADLDNRTTFPATNETTHGLRLSADALTGIDWIEIEVRARFVAPGNIQGGVGLDGTHTGFSLAIKGVERDTDDWDDKDGDGVANLDDACPNQNAFGWDLDVDGCLDDFDQDGVTDNLDVCPEENALGWDLNADGCIDDTDDDGVLDSIDLCETLVLSASWPVDQMGCRPVDVRPEITIEETPADDFVWNERLILRWSVTDDDGDGYQTGAEVFVIDNRSDGGGYIIASCQAASNATASFECEWDARQDLPVWNIEEAWIRLDIHVQSTNASPEADNSRVVLQSEERFKGEYITEFDAGPGDDLGVDKEEKISSLRTIFWGILCLVGACLFVYRLGQQSTLPKDAVAVPIPFAQQGETANLGHDVENE